MTTTPAALEAVEQHIAIFDAYRWVTLGEVMNRSAEFLLEIGTHHRPSRWIADAIGIISLVICFKGMSFVIDVTFGWGWCYPYELGGYAGRFLSERTGLPYTEGWVV